MSDEEAISSQLRDTQEGLIISREFSRLNPDSSSMRFAVDAIRKRELVLSNRHAHGTYAAGLDVCDYRISSPTDTRLPVWVLGHALVGFQETLTAFFDAVMNGPKERASADVSTTLQSRLNFDYCYSGSVGVVLSIENERLLGVESKLDEAMALLVGAAHAKTAEEVQAYSHKLGRAAIRKLFRWANTQHDGGLAATIAWKRNHIVRSELVSSVDDWATLKNAIENVSEDREEKQTIEGLLVGLDVSTQRFHMEVDGLGSVKGEISPKLGTKITVNLGSRYTAHVWVKRRVRLAMDQDELDYTLLDIDTP